MTNATRLSTRQFILKCSGIIFWVLGLNIPLYAQTPLSNTKSSPTVTPPPVKNSASITTTLLKDNLILATLIMGVVSGVISGLINTVTGKKILELKELEISEIKEGRSVEIQEKQINYLNAQISDLNAQNDDLRHTLSIRPNINIPEQLIDVSKLTEKVVESLKKISPEFDSNQSKNELIYLKKQISLLENSLQILKPINKRFEVYQNIEQWLITQLSKGLAEEASQHALRNSNTILSDEEIDNFVQSLKKYLKWVCASLKAYAPIGIRKNKLEPVLPSNIYFSAFDFIKNKAYAEIPTEELSELSNFLEHLFAQLFS